jgi:hypothetical protein
MAASNADHRPLRQLARRQQARIAKAGDDVTVHALLSAELTCSRTPTAAMASSSGLL